MKNQLRSATLPLMSFMLFLLAICRPVWALHSDATEIAHFRADHISLNDNDGTTIYAGHVQMQQGTTHLMADQVVVQNDKDGNMEKSIATGKPAHYNTLPDQQKNPIEALGDRIEYYPKQQVAVIMGNGQVIQAGNSLRGLHIIYDMVQQTVSSVPSLKQTGIQSWITLQPWALPGQKNTD